MEKDSENVIPGILNQLDLIYCTQVHLYERCTELVNMREFKDMSTRLSLAIRKSYNRMKIIEHFYRAASINNSLENCDILYTYLEKKFAPNYDCNQVVVKSLHMNDYLLNNHYSASAADYLIRMLIVQFYSDNRKNKSCEEIKRLLGKINISMPELMI